MRTFVINTPLVAEDTVKAQGVGGADGVGHVVGTGDALFAPGRRPSRSASAGSSLCFMVRVSADTLGMGHWKGRPKWAAPSLIC